MWHFSKEHLILAFVYHIQKEWIHACRIILSDFSSLLHNKILLIFYQSHLVKLCMADLAYRGQIYIYIYFFIFLLLQHLYFLDAMWRPVRRESSAPDPFQKRFRFPDLWQNNCKSVFWKTTEKRVQHIGILLVVSGVRGLTHSTPQPLLAADHPPTKNRKRKMHEANLHYPFGPMWTPSHSLHMGPRKGTIYRQAC